MKNMTNMKALEIALNYAGIADEESLCIRNRLSDGLFEITVRTIDRKYDFYVDAANRDVRGFNAEPYYDRGLLCVCRDERFDSAA